MVCLSGLEEHHFMDKGRQETMKQKISCTAPLLFHITENFRYGLRNFPSI